MTTSLAVRAEELWYHRFWAAGSAGQVADGLDEFVDRFGVQEMLVSTRVHGEAAKLRSMELITGAYARPGRVAR